MISALNQLVDYIDGHLTEEIAVDDLAVSLGMTEYHLRRMFSSLAGMPLSEYVRRRRMTVAATEVLDGGELLAIAVRYGYGSTEAFSRASGQFTAPDPATCAGTAGPFARNRSSGSA